MTNEELECVLEEEVSYLGTPPEVLASLERLRKRCDQHKIDEPGIYREVGPSAHWSSANLRSSWRIEMWLYRTPPIVDEAVVVPAAVPVVVTVTEPLPSATIAPPVELLPPVVETTSETVVEDAVKIGTAASDDAGNCSGPEVRVKGRRVTKGGA